MSLPVFLPGLIKSQVIKKKKNPNSVHIGWLQKIKKTIFCFEKSSIIEKKIQWNCHKTETRKKSSWFAHRSTYYLLYGLTLLKFIYKNEVKKVSHILYRHSTAYSARSTNFFQWSSKFSSIYKVWNSRQNCLKQQLIVIILMAGNPSVKKFQMFWK